MGVGEFLISFVDNWEKEWPMSAVSLTNGTQEYFTSTTKTGTFITIIHLMKYLINVWQTNKLD